MLLAYSWVGVWSGLVWDPGRWPCIGYLGQEDMPRYAGKLRATATHTKPDHTQLEARGLPHQGGLGAPGATKAALPAAGATKAALAAHTAPKPPSWHSRDPTQLANSIASGKQCGF